MEIQEQKSKKSKLIIKWLGRFVLTGISAVLAFFVFPFLFISLEDWFIYNISYREYKTYLIVIEIFTGTMLWGVLIYSLIGLIRPIKRKLKTIFRILISFFLGGAIFNLIYWLTYGPYSDAGQVYTMLSGIPAFTIIFYWVLNKFFKKKVFLKVVIIVLVVTGFIVFYRIQYNYLVKVLDKIENIDSIKYRTLLTDENDIIDAQNVYREGRGEKTKLRVENGKPDNIKFILLADLERGTIYHYLPDKNTARQTKIGDEFYYEGSESNFLDTNESIKQNKPMIIGIDNLDGKRCLVIKEFYSSDYYSGIYGFEALTRWIWVDYGLTIKSKLDKYSSVTKENIEINIDIPDDLFVLPQGVVITTLTPE